MDSLEGVDTRQRIITVTAELLQRFPAEAVSTRDICKAARVTAPTLYYHFGDKVGLLDAVAAFGYETYFTGEQSFAHSTDPIEILLYAWDAHVEFGVSHPALYTLMFGTARSDADSPAAQKARALIAAVLTSVAQAGRLRTDIDKATLVVEAAYVGTTLQAIRGGFDPVVSRQLRDAVLGSIVTGITERSVADSLAGTANQLAAHLSNSNAPATALRPTELALFREWLRLLTVPEHDSELIGSAL
ncbi:TetR/AcrR family transcriptional regulator [soil metagenome]